MVDSTIYQAAYVYEGGQAESSWEVLVLNAEVEF